MPSLQRLLTQRCCNRRPFLIENAPVVSNPGTRYPVSLRSGEAARRTRTVFEAVVALVGEGATHFRPGDVATHLRDAEHPIGAWEIRGEFSKLEQMELIEVDPELAIWRLVDGGEFSIEEARRLAMS